MKIVNLRPRPGWLHWIGDRDRIQRAIEQAEPGDVVLLEEGEYRHGTWFERIIRFLDGFIVIGLIVMKLLIGVACLLTIVLAVASAFTGDFAVAFGLMGLGFAQWILGKWMTRVIQQQINEDDRFLRDAIEIGKTRIEGKNQ